MPNKSDAINKAFELQSAALSATRKAKLDQNTAVLTSFINSLVTEAPGIAARDEFVANTKAIIDSTSAAFDSVNKNNAELVNLVRQGINRDQLSSSAQVAQLRDAFKAADPDRLTLDETRVSFLDLDGNEVFLDEFTGFDPQDLDTIRNNAVAKEKAKYEDLINQRMIEIGDDVSSGLTRRERAIVSLFGIDGVDYETIFGPGREGLAPHITVEALTTQEFLDNPERAGDLAVELELAKLNELNRRLDFAEFSEQQRLDKNTEISVLRQKIAEQRSSIGDVLSAFGGTPEEIEARRSVNAESDETTTQQRLNAQAQRRAQRKRRQAPRFTPRPL